MLVQVDMREFLNAPNGSSKQSRPVNERPDADPSQSPLGGRTVWQSDRKRYKWFLEGYNRTVI